MEVQEFRIAIPQADLDDLHRRLDATRWPQALTGEDWSRGVPLTAARKLAETWRTTYDWRREEAALNRWPQFVTTIDGQTLHFVHVRSRRPDAKALLLVHGYPASFVEYLGILGALSEEFHLVVPSLPGFGFSTPLSGPGWEISRTAAAFDQLMVGLGYPRYGVQGGDIGAGICAQLATKADRVIGTLIHTEPASLGTPYTPPTDHLSDDEKGRLAEYRAQFEDRRGYLHLQSSRPRTIGYDLTDSPVGQLTWIAEKVQEWSDPPGVMDDPALVTQMLTNVSLYWFTRTGATAAEFLYQAAHATGGWAGMPVVPVGMASFGREPLVRRVFDPDHRLAYWSEHDRGGHFPAVGAPELLVEDIRGFFLNR